MAHTGRMRCMAICGMVHAAWAMAVATWPMDAGGGPGGARANSPEIAEKDAL